VFPHFHLFLELFQLSGFYFYWLLSPPVSNSVTNLFLMLLIAGSPAHYGCTTLRVVGERSSPRCSSACSITVYGYGFPHRAPCFSLDVSKLLLISSPRIICFRLPPLLFCGCYAVPPFSFDVFWPPPDRFDTDPQAPSSLLS